MFTQEFWDERYGSRPQLWSGNPNPHLVAEAAELTPGAALDVGSGEGADAIWLAEHGWQVTAIDVSPVALARGAEHAAAAGSEIAGRIDWRQADVLRWGPEPAAFDLISSQFMHLPPEPREALFTRLAEGITPGGTLLVVGHHPIDLMPSDAHQAMAELRFTAAQVAGLLDPERWEILVEAAPERQMTDPAGDSVTAHDAVLRARRRP
jgi:SAM-dependent methyltransferase